tara:strand:+ start:176 stop:469 length:294 start_codon:yes stop_codon:yes gene_type:complete
VLTAITGSILIKREGIRTIKRIKAFGLSDQEQLLNALGDGFFIVISGILLLTPGFITDLVGILLFLKKTRRAIINLFINRINFSFFSKIRHNGARKD